MPNVTVLDVRLYGEPVATLTNLQDGRTIFALNDAYIEDEKRPTLSSIGAGIKSQRFASMRRGSKIG